jgi:hypothetical protein
VARKAQVIRNVFGDKRDTEDEKGTSDKEKYESM